MKIKELSSNQAIPVIGRVIINSPKLEFAIICIVNLYKLNCDINKATINKVSCNSDYYYQFKKNGKLFNVFHINKRYIFGN